MDWKETDERLIRRGELILDPKHLENPRQELKTMNKHKRGRNYHISNTYIQLLAAIRYLYNMPYRQLEGFTRALHRLVPTTPPRADYSGIRKRILRLSTDDVHDVKALPGLVDGAEANVEVSKVIGDGAYDSGRVYDFLEGRGIEAVVKPRRNSRLDTRCPGRRLAVGRVRELGYEAWARLTDYGRRWAVETVYSTFKRVFGEHSLARSFENIARELVGKVALYNMMVNM
jgi:hypothetical protein